MFCFVYLRSVSCVPNIFNVSGLSILVVPSVFSNVYMSIAKKIRLIRSLKEFIFRYQNLVEIYSVSAETMINDAFFI